MSVLVVVRHLLSISAAVTRPASAHITMAERTNIVVSVCWSWKWNLFACIGRAWSQWQRALGHTKFRCQPVRACGEKECSVSTIMGLPIKSRTFVWVTDYNFQHKNAAKGKGYRCKSLFSFLRLTVSLLLQPSVMIFVDGSLILSGDESYGKNDK